MDILFVDACPRAESRTRRLAEAVLGRMQGNVCRLKLSDCQLPYIDEKTAAKRGQDAKRGDFADPLYDLAKQFAAADRILIAAPFWDLSFPALLKRYIEAIMVTGITFRYSEEGVPIGLCKAKSLTYVTTAGGPIFNEEFGYGYVRALAQTMFGIADCRCYKAENLDVVGVDAETILQQAISKLSKEV